MVAVCIAGPFGSVMMLTEQGTVKVGGVGGRAGIEGRAGRVKGMWRHLRNGPLRLLR